MPNFYKNNKGSRTEIIKVLERHVFQWQSNSLKYFPTFYKIRLFWNRSFSAQSQTRFILSILRLLLTSRVWTPDGAVRWQRRMLKSMNSIYTGKMSKGKGTCTQVGCVVKGMGIEGWKGALKVLASRQVCEIPSTLALSQAQYSLGNVQRPAKWTVPILTCSFWQADFTGLR